MDDELQFIEGTERRIRRGIKGQIYITNHVTGKKKKQWVIASYPEGESYVHVQVDRKLPDTPTQVETLPVQPEKIRALSVRQPYAEMIITGEKKIEYRSKNTKVRGRIYIYSSATKYNKDDTQDIADQTGLSIDEIKSFPRKVIVGSVEVYDTQEGESGYEWLLRNPIRFAEPRSPDPDQRANPVWFNPFGTDES